jgi:hypothetical protein
MDDFDEEMFFLYCSLCIESWALMLVLTQRIITAAKEPERYVKYGKIIQKLPD